MIVPHPNLTLNSANRNFYLWSVSTRSACQNLLFQWPKNHRIRHRQKSMRIAKFLVIHRGKVVLIRRILTVIIAKNSFKSQANIRRVHIIRGFKDVKMTTSKRSTMGDRWVSAPCSGSSLKEQINRWNQSDHSTMCSSLSRLWPPKTLWHSNLLWCILRWGMCQVYLCPFHTRWCRHLSSSSLMVHSLTRRLHNLLSTWASNPKIWSAEATLEESNL